MADSIIMERVADAAAECFCAKLVKTEDLGAFEALVAAAKGAGGARGKIAELAAYAANHASEIRPPAHELGTIEGANAHIGAARLKGQGRSWSRRGAEAIRLIRCALATGRPLVAPAASPWFTEKQANAAASVVEKRGRPYPRRREGAGSRRIGRSRWESRDDIPISKELGSCYH